MTDREIIQRLIARDDGATRQFFFVSCRPLLTAIMRLVFNYQVEYDEMVSELYQYLMADDCRRLRCYDYRSTFHQWLKVVATRFFIRQRDLLIENSSTDALYNREDTDTVDTDSHHAVTLKIDIEALLELMENPRYADVIRHLILADEDPRRYADSIGVTIDNLYNIKRRAMAALARIASKHYSYGR